MAKLNFSNRVLVVTDSLVRVSTGSSGYLCWMLKKGSFCRTQSQFLNEILPCSSSDSSMLVMR